MSVSGSMGITSLAKGMMRDAKRYANRDIGQELIKVAQDELTDKNQKLYQGDTTSITSSSRSKKGLPTVKYLNEIAQDVKIINEHMAATNNLGRQYEKLLHNSRHLDRTLNNIEEQVVLNTLRQIKTSQNGDLLTGQNCIPMRLQITPERSVAGNNVIAHALQQPQASVTQPQNIFSEPQNNHFEVEVQTTPPRKIVSGKNIFSDEKTGNNYKIVPLDYVTSA